MVITRFVFVSGINWIKLTHRGKTKFATVKWYNLCLQIIQSQMCYPLVLKLFLYWSFCYWMEWKLTCFTVCFTRYRRISIWHSGTSQRENIFLWWCYTNRNSQDLPAIKNRRGSQSCHCYCSLSTSCDSAIQHSTVRLLTMLSKSDLPIHSQDWCINFRHE